MPQPETLLDEMLASRGSEPWELPPLVAEKGWVARHLEQLQEWMDRWLGTQIGAHRNLLKDLAEMALYFCGFLLIALILYSLYRFFCGWRAKGAEAEPETDPRVAETEEQRLLRRLAEARAAGRFGEAGRIRWKLFLERSRIGVPLTPREYEARSGPAFREEIDTLDRLFFGVVASETDALPLFEGWDRRFSLLERRQT